MSQKPNAPLPPEIQSPWTTERPDIQPPPPMRVDYRLLNFPQYPSLDDIHPFLSDKGMELMHALPEKELRKMAQWWENIKKAKLSKLTMLLMDEA